MSKMDLDLAFPSEYLGAIDLAGRTVTVKIKHVTVEQVDFEGKKEPRHVVTFEPPVKKQWLINKTNSFAIGVLLWRSDMESFVGKSVTLTTDEDIIKGEPTDCIRVCGSPDATPRGLAEFKRCWDHKGGRMNNKLVGRLKRVMVTIKAAERLAKAEKKAESTTKAAPPPPPSETPPAETSPAESTEPPAAAPLESGGE